MAARFVSPLPTTTTTTTTVVLLINYFVEWFDYPFDFVILLDGQPTQVKTFLIDCDRGRAAPNLPIAVWWWSHCKVHRSWIKVLRDPFRKWFHLWTCPASGWIAQWQLSAGVYSALCSFPRCPRFLIQFASKVCRSWKLYVPISLSLKALK